MRTVVRMFFLNKVFICLVQDLYDKICEFITSKWIDAFDGSIRSFATNHDVDEKTVRKIKNWKEEHYKITIVTLEKLCKSRDLTLEDFFKQIKR